MISQFDNTAEAVAYLVRALRDSTADGEVEVAWHPKGALDAIPDETTVVPIKEVEQALNKYCCQFPAAVAVYEWTDSDLKIGAIECCQAATDEEFTDERPIVSAVVSPKGKTMTKEEKRAELRYFHKMIRDRQHSQA